MSRIIIRFKGIETSGPEFDAVMALGESIGTQNRFNIAGALVVPEEFKKETSSVDPELYCGVSSNGARGIRPAYHTFEFVCRIVRE